MQKFLETRGGVGKSGMLEHKSSKISEMRKDGWKVTTEWLLELTNALSNGTTLLQNICVFWRPLHKF